MVTKLRPARALRAAAFAEILESRRLLAAFFSGSDPDDQISEAIVLQPDTALNRDIAEEQDVDMFTFASEADGEFVITTDADFDNYMRLFDDQGNQLAADDDSGPGTSAEIRYTFDTAGNYYVGISGLGNNSYDPITGGDDDFGGTGSFSITLLTFAADEDDQISEAPELELDGAAVSDEINPGTDVDMHKVTLGAFEDVLIKIGNPQSPLDAIVRVFDEQGWEVRYTSGFGEFEVEFTPEFSGDYYIGISGYDNYSYNPITGTNDLAGDVGKYTIQVQRDDRDDQIDEDGTTLFVNDPRQRSISRSIDVDGFFIDFVNLNQRFGIDIDRFGAAALDSYLRIFRVDPDTGAVQQVASSDNRAAPGESAANGESYIEYTFTQPGSYYVFVSGSPNKNYDPITGDGDVAGDVGDYVITMTEIFDTDDQATGEEAAPTPLGATISGRAIEYDIDVDMYRFIVAAGTTMSFDVDLPSGSSLNSYLRIFQGDANRTQIAANDNAAAPGESTATKESFIQYRFDTAGEYFISVSGFPNASFNPITGEGDFPGSGGGYTLGTKVISIAPPAPTGDADDQISEARSISISSPRLNQDIASKDVDMYKLTVSAGQRIGFDVDRTNGNLDSYLRLFRSNGTQLAANDDGKAPGEGSGPSAYLDYTFSTAGTYYVGISGDSNRSYNPTNGSGDVSGSTGGYSLLLLNRNPSASRAAPAAPVAAAFRSVFRSGGTIESLDIFPA